MGSSSTMIWRCLLGGNGKYSNKHQRGSNLTQPRISSRLHTYPSFSLILSEGMGGDSFLNISYSHWHMPGKTCSLWDVNNGADIGDTYPIILSAEQQHTASCFGVALDDDKPDNKFLKLFHLLILSIFTSQPLNAEKCRFHLPVEAFILESSLDVDGLTCGPGNIAPCLSKLQYDTQFSILYDALMGGGDISRYVS